MRNQKVCHWSEYNMQSKLASLTSLADMRCEWCLQPTAKHLSSCIQIPKIDMGVSIPEKQSKHCQRCCKQSTPDLT